MNNIYVYLNYYGITIIKLNLKDIYIDLRIIGVINVILDKIVIITLNNLVFKNIEFKKKIKPIKMYQKNNLCLH